MENCIFYRSDVLAQSLLEVFSFSYLNLNSKIDTWNMLSTFYWSSQYHRQNKHSLKRLLYNYIDWIIQFIGIIGLSSVGNTSTCESVICVNFPTKGKYLVCWGLFFLVTYAKAIQHRNDPSCGKYVLHIYFCCTINQRKICRK